jgi:hypothetical protein
MYQTISELFLGLIVLAYSVFLAALSWWGLAPRLRPVLKTLGFASAQASQGRPFLDGAVETRRTQIEDRRQQR